MDFAEACAEWAEQAEVKLTYIVRQSMIDIVDFMQMIGPSTAYPEGQGGYNPVDTGWHTSHIEVSFSDMPDIDPNSYPPSNLFPGWGLHLLRWDRSKTVSELSRAPIDGWTFIGYTAAYSVKLEYRAAPSSAFVRKAAQRWEMIVRANVAKMAAVDMPEAGLADAG